MEDDPNNRQEVDDHHNRQEVDDHNNRQEVDDHLKDNPTLHATLSMGNEGISLFKNKLSMYPEKVEF